MQRRLALGSILVAILLVVAWFWLREQPEHGLPSVTELPVAESLAPDVDLTAPRTPTRTPDVKATSDSARTIAAPLEPERECVTVRVVDIDRTPIAGARVETFGDSTAGVSKSDAEGRAMTSVPSAESEEMRLEVSAPGFFHQRSDFGCWNEILIVLARTVRVRGRVLEKGTLRPIPGAQIDCVHSHCKGCDPDRVLCDANGRFDAVGVRIGPDSRFLISPEGFPAQTAFVSTEDSGPIVEHDFVLDPGLVISGSVVDFSSGLPVAHAVVECAGLDVARTSADGRFTARVPSVSGNIRLEFGAREYCRLTRDWTPEELLADTPLRVTLPRGAFVEGTVRDESGAPVPDTSLSVFVDNALLGKANRDHELGVLSDLTRTWRVNNQDNSFLYVTDAAGRFRTGALVPFAPLVHLESEPNEHGRFETRVGPLGPPGQSTFVDLVLRREDHGTIAGRVLLNGVGVRARVTWTGPTRSGSANADQRGRFELDRVEAGRIVVRTMRDRYRESRLLNREDIVELVPGQRLERDFGVDFATKPVIGRVVRATGGAAGEHSILFGESPSRPDGYRCGVKSAPTGEFAMDLPDDGSIFEASLEENGHVFARDGIRAGDRDLEIVITEVPSVLCRAIDSETREALETYTAYARSAGTGEYENISVLGPTSTDGGWRMLPLAAGAFDIVVASPELGYPITARENIVVSPRGDAHIEFEMQRGTAIEFRLASGVTPWKDSQYVVLLEAELAETLEKLPERMTSLRGANARFPGIDAGIARQVDLAKRSLAVVRALAPGRYRLYDLLRGLTFTPEVIEVRDGEPASIDVGWRAR